MVLTFPQEEKWVLNTLLRVCMHWFVVPEQWPNKPFPSFWSQISRSRNIPTPRHESRFQIDKYFIYRYSVGLLLLKILRRIWEHEVCSCDNQITQALPWSCGNLHRWDPHLWRKACLNGRSSENCQMSRFMYDKVSTMTNKFVKPGVRTYLLPNLHHFLGTFSNRGKSPLHLTQIRFWDHWEHLEWLVLSDLCKEEDIYTTS